MGVSGPSLLIESTDSMIIIDQGCSQDFRYGGKGGGGRGEREGRMDS